MIIKQIADCIQWYDYTTETTVSQCIGEFKNKVQFFFFFFLLVTHAPNGSWTHDPTLHPIIMRDRSASWAITHWQNQVQLLE